MINRTIICGILLLSLSAITRLHAMAPAQPIDSIDQWDRDQERLQEYAQTITKEILPFVDNEPLLTQLIAGYAVPTPHEIKQAHAQLIRAIETNNHKETIYAFNNGTDANLNVSFDQNTSKLLPHVRLKVIDCLSYAIIRGAPLTIITTLLSHDADPNPPNIDGISPIHRATTPEMVETLVAYGADVNAVDQNGRNALWYLCPALPLSGYLDVKKTYKLAKKLITCSIDIYHRDNDNQTALHNSASRQFEGFSKALVKFKADVNATDNNSNTPLHLVVNWPFRFEPTHEWIQKTQKLALLLVNANANPLSKNNQGESSLDKACSFNPEVAHSMLNTFTRSSVP